MAISFGGAPLPVGVKTMSSYIKTENAQRLVKPGLWASNPCLLHIVDMSA
jgi:hypothetical protein